MADPHLLFRGKQSKEEFLHESLGWLLFGGEIGGKGIMRGLPILGSEKNRMDQQPFPEVVSTREGVKRYMNANFPPEGVTEMTRRSSHLWIWLAQRSKL